MKIFKLCIVVLFIILFPDVSFAEENTVTKIIDPYTIEVNDTYRIHLYGISTSMFEEYEEFKGNFEKAPLKIQSKKIKDAVLYVDDIVTFDQQNAINEIEKILLNKTIYLKEVEKDDYLISFSADDDLTINELIVAEGLANMADLIKPEYKMRFLHAEKTAKDNKSGIWGIRYQSNSVSNSEVIIGKGIYKVLAIIIIVNVMYLLFTIKQLSNIPSWSGLFYGFISLLFIPLPVIIVAIQYQIAAKIYLGICLIIILVIFYILSKFILKHIEILNIKKLSALIVGSVLVVISYFTFVYAVFDNPRIVHISQKDFFSGKIYTDEKEVIGDYISVNGRTDYLNDLGDYLYLSGTTFFGGSYGDVIPNGNIRFIVVLEMFIGFLLQLLFFSIVINLIYDKFIKSKNIVEETSKQDEKDTMEREDKECQVEEVPLKTSTRESLDRETTNLSAVLATCIVLFLEIFKSKKD
ncbi:hypothetical protein CSV63_12150 [Sporosarcina sp. P34]|uniref:thermonuclease family protein n=1 Tax=Sporosarcina sp. P34 TaxID=2048247 RepID=UPI000C16B4BD|nr:thermonuclease family protein [Sporosarcina sp. P34]PID14519.1 hypothetical protein CSV63_12150 [Sporosarcina sp. P34]